jgi:hypothetical protein
MRQLIINLVDVPEAKINELLRLLQEMGISYESNESTEEEIAEHNRIIDRGVQEFDEGEFIPNEDFKKEIDKW